MSQWVMLNREAYLAAQGLIFDSEGNLHEGVSLDPGSFGTPFYVQFGDPEEQEVFVGVLDDAGVRYHFTNRGEA